MNNCGGCDATWTGTSPCHCSGCHHTWSGIELFDRHRHARGERGGCIPPDQITIRGHNLEYRDNAWRGPAMTDEQKAARFGSAA